MKTITSILVPTDFSVVARNAFNYALRLADILDADVELLHCIPPSTANPGYFEFTPHLPTLMQGKAERDMEAFIHNGLTTADRQIDHPPHVSSVVKGEELRESIADRVGRMGHQLLVVGTAGRRNGWNDFLGTNASYLIKQAPCPVLVVPQNTTYRPIERLCFATDLCDANTAQAGRLLRMLRPFQPAIDFFHVQMDEKEEAKYYEDLARQVFDHSGKEPKANYVNRRADDLVGAVFAYAFESNCDMVVMYRPARPWFERLLHKSNTSEAVLRARLPLLIFNDSHLVAADAAPPVDANHSLHLRPRP